MFPPNRLSIFREKTCVRNPSGWAPPVAETRADDRAHGVGRSPAHSSFKGAGPETHDALRSQKTVNSKGDAELLSLFEEELGGTRVDRLSDVRSQERVQYTSCPLLRRCRSSMLLRRWWWNSWSTSLPWWKRRKGKRTRGWTSLRRRSSQGSQ